MDGTDKATITPGKDDADLTGLYRPPLRIDAEAWYDEELLRVNGTLDGDTLKKARKAGRLRGKVEGRKVVYKGQWLLDWLESRETVSA